MLKLNLKKTMFYLIQVNSNTTLVKVKWYIYFSSKTFYINSNTTLVKVKFYLYKELLLSQSHSNTTLVKVKSLLRCFAFCIYPIQIQHLLKLNH